jgi:hypothetical protein
MQLSLRRRTQDSRAPAQLPDETMYVTGVHMRSYKLFDLELPAAAALTLEVG